MKSVSADVAPAFLADELEQVERRLLASIESREPRLTEIARYLIGSGGKRMRPLVALVVFRACGGTELDEVLDVAVALELIHSATLLHDDIIDGGELRRGRTSAYRKYGSTDTLVAGDFLFSKAFELCGRFEESVVRWAADACVRLTEGEILQGRFRRNAAATAEDYREIIDRKTASVFQQGARIAAQLAEAPRTTVDSIARCGRAIGMAFQVVDDLLDVTGEDQRTGKTIGIDLRDGNPSLPIVLAIREDPELLRIWQDPQASSENIATGLERIAASGALGRVRDEALGYTRAAIREIQSLPSTPYQRRLEALVWELAGRVS